MTKPEPCRWAFNRRTVEDQILYVRAATLEEAWAKARANDGEDTCDPEIIRTTYRRSPEDD